MPVGPDSSDVEQVFYHHWVRTGDTQIDWDGLAGQYRLVYQTALRSLEGQEANLDNLRSRVAQLIAAAAIATSFLGGLALTDAASGFGWLTWPRCCCSRA